MIRSLASVVIASNHTRCVSLTNQKSMTQPTLVNLHSHEYPQGLWYYPFAVILDVLEVVKLLMVYLTEYVFQAKEDLNLSVVNMIARINETKISHVSNKCEFKFDSKKCNLESKVE